MDINEKQMKVIIDALVERIKDLELEVWMRDERIEKLTAQLCCTVEIRCKLSK